MIPDTNGTGRVETLPVAPVLEDRSSRPSEAPDTFLMLLRPPRYEPDPIRVHDLGAILTVRGAREGLVVVWEIRSTNGGPVLPHATRSVLRRRPATLDLLVTHPRPSTSRDRAFREAVEEITRPLRPTAVLTGCLNGHTAGVRQLLGKPTRGLAGEIVELLLYRGLVMHSVLQQVAEEILREALPFGECDGARHEHDFDERRVRRMFDQAGLPGPERWMQLGKVIAFVMAYRGGDSTLASAAHQVGEPDPDVVLRQLRTLTGVEADELVLRLGWRWVLEAWIQKEMSEGGFSDEQRDRVLMMGRGAGTDGRIRVDGSDDTHGYPAADA